MYNDSTIKPNSSAEKYVWSISLNIEVYEIYQKLTHPSRGRIWRCLTWDINTPTVVPLTRHGTRTPYNQCQYHNRSFFMHFTCTSNFHRMSTESISAVCRPDICIRGCLYCRWFNRGLFTDMQDFGALSSKTVTEVLMLEMKMAPAAKTYLVSGYPRSMRDVAEYSDKVFMSCFCSLDEDVVVPMVFWNFFVRPMVWFKLSGKFYEFSCQLSERWILCIESSFTRFRLIKAIYFSIEIFFRYFWW